MRVNSSVLKREIGYRHACKWVDGDWPHTFMPSDPNQNLSIVQTDFPGEDVIFGRTAAMQQVRLGLQRAVREGLPVLIQGESGTGKEVIAKYLHLLSASDGESFIKMNCIAFTRSLLFSRLRQGDANRPAWQTQGDGDGEIARGTLFLDEIGDMDWKLQEELIDLLSSQDAGHRGEAVRRASVRIVCSTRIGSGTVVAGTASREGTLVRLYLPALRERAQDIPQLCAFLMQRQARRFGRNPQALTARTLHLLAQWQWPGNLRELENWVARVVILGSQERLAEELRDQAFLDGAPKDLSGIAETATDQPEQVVSAATEAAILRILEAHGWSRRRAARELRMSYRALLGRLRNANMPRRRRSHKESPPMG